MTQVKPRAVDLCCGSGGVTEALLDAGYEVTGVDIVKHPKYPRTAGFILADVIGLNGLQFASTRFMWASPPCVEFSRWRMPWTRELAREPSLAIVDACYRIRDEAQPDVFILENVREAQRWLGKANLQRAERYLWGDVLLAPAVQARAKESFSGLQADLRARVPHDLVFALAMMAKENPRLQKHLEAQP